MRDCAWASTIGFWPISLLCRNHLCLCLWCFFSLSKCWSLTLIRKKYRIFLWTVVEFLFKVFFFSRWTESATHLRYICIALPGTRRHINVCILPINYQFGMNIYTFSTLAKKVSHNNINKKGHLLFRCVSVCFFYSIYYCCWFCYHQNHKMWVCIGNEFLFAERLRRRKKTD